MVSTDIFNHPMFARAPKLDEFRGRDGNYFTINYAFRSLIGTDLLSR